MGNSGVDIFFVLLIFFGLSIYVVGTAILETDSGIETTMKWNGEPTQFETEITRQPCPHPNSERMCDGS